MTEWYIPPKKLKDFNVPNGSIYYDSKEKVIYKLVNGKWEEVRSEMR